MIFILLLLNNIIWTVVHTITRNIYSYIFTPFVAMTLVVAAWVVKYKNRLAITAVKDV